MPRRKISQEDKLWLLQAHLEGQDYVQVAITLVFSARSGARRVKVDNEIGEAAARIIEEHPEFTLQ